VASSEELRTSPSQHSDLSTILPEGPSDSKSYCATMPSSLVSGRAMPFSTSKYIKFRQGMQKRIGSLRSKTEDSLDVAIDVMMEERVDSFFRVEQGLEEIIRSLIEIEEDLESIRDLSGAMRLESRLEFAPTCRLQQHPGFFQGRIRLSHFRIVAVNHTYFG